MVCTAFPYRKRRRALADWMGTWADGGQAAAMSGATGWR
jgi:hypothetical protein